MAKIGANTNLLALKHFGDTLQRFKQNSKPNIKNPKLKQIIAIAKEEIEAAYSGKIAISVEVKQNESGFTIYAKDKSKRPIIAFDEFGTGYYAKGTYPGELPTQTITFTSSGKTRTTKGWIHYYGNPYDKSVKNPSPAKIMHGGIYGWMTPNGIFHTGQVANATMYNACKRIIKRVRNEVVKW